MQQAKRGDPWTPSNAFSSLFSPHPSQETVPPTFRIGLPTWINLINKLPPKCAWVNLDPIKMTAYTVHHKQAGLMGLGIWILLN